LRVLKGKEARYSDKVEK